VTAEPLATTAPAVQDAALVELERALRHCAKLMFSRALATHLPGGVRIDRASYACLVTLAERGELRLSDLAQRMELDVSTVSRHVRFLEGAGLVVRRSDPDDGRAALLALTPSGENALEIQLEARTAVLGEATQDWNDADRDALRSLLSRLAAATGRAGSCQGDPVPTNSLRP
jgi:DNA-binding MarR family transcriptional regulator